MTEIPPLVSICIPTYNRAEYLKNSLDSLIDQSEFKNGMVSIVISDNSSTDGTQDLCEQYQNRYTGMHYYRNDDNIRDLNFPKVFSEADGLFLKMSKDTLLYQKNSLKMLCDIIEQYKDTKPVLYFTNGHKSNLLKKNDKDFDINIESIRKFYTERAKINTLDDFMYCTSYRITDIGGFGMWHSDFDQYGMDVESTSLQLWQVDKLCQMVTKKKNAVVISDCLFSIQAVKNKNITYGLYHVFYDNFLSILKKNCNEHSLSSQCYEWIRKDLLFNFFTDWTVKWKLGSKNLNYNENEDLLTLIKKAYSSADYYSDFLSYYKRRVFIFRIRKILHQKLIIRRHK